MLGRQSTITHVKIRESQPKIIATSRSHDKSARGDAIKAYQLHQLWYGFCHVVRPGNEVRLIQKENPMAEYAHPEVLVSTAWVAEHRTDPTVRIVESDEDILLYEVGHIPGAVKIDWQSELQHQIIRDYVDKEAFGKLVGSKGIRNDHTVVFYGDRNNWWACYAFWVFNADFRGQKMTHTFSHTMAEVRGT